MGFYKTEAVVLRNRDFREADQLVTLFSLDYGKIKAVARGARKPKSRLRGGIQAFTWNDLMLHTGRNLDIITGCDIRRSFYFREDLDKLTNALYWADLLERILPEREANPALYALFINFLQVLDSLPDNPKMTDDYRVLSHLFELKLANLAGYRPDLNQCGYCQKPLTPAKGRVWFSLGLGGVVCPVCVQAPEVGFLPLSLGTLKIMQYWLGMPVQQFYRLKVTKSNRQELKRILPAFLEYYLEQGISSGKLVRDLGDNLP